MITPRLLTALWLPLVWSAALAIRRGPPTAGDDAAERRRLFLMILPAAIGVGLVGLAAHLPTTFGTRSPVPESWLPAAANASPASFMPSSTRPRPVDIGALTAGLYVAVTALLAVRLLNAERRLWRLVRESTPHPSQRRVRWTSARITPFAAPNGTIILPEALGDHLEKDQVDLIIAHERAHLDRRDPAFFRCLAWIDVAFWFNPFVRRQTGRCRLAVELAVDDIVVRNATCHRTSYARSLIEVLKWTGTPAPRGSPAISRLTPKGVYALRINNILRPRASRTASRLVLWVFTAFLAPLVAVQWSYAESTAGTALPFKMRPLDGKVTFPFGRPYKGLLGLNGHHKGIDIKAPHGTPIYAPGAGKVIKVRKSDKGYGNMLIIDHGDGVRSRYAHLSRFDVKVGDRVEAGMTIGRVGSSGRSTGPHLHFEVMKNGKRIDPATVTPAKK